MVRTLSHSTFVRTILAAAIIGISADARAVDIVLQYNGTAADNPSFDPQAIGLTIALQQVEAMYEDVINDPYTLTLRYRWESDPTLGTLADHQLITKANGREIEGQLRFYSANANPFDPRVWFLDLTPQDHSEFDMAQTLWRNLTPEQKTGQFDFGANIPETYEVAYWGQAKSTAPIEARTGFDMLTVAAHEVGHGLGLNASSEAQSEAADGDFDFDPAFVNGRTMAADERGDAAHLWAQSLMNPIVNPTRRFLPAMTDVFSMASVNNLVSLDLDRREFWGGSNWNTAGAWAGNRLPSSDDDVFIRDPSTSGSIVMGLTANGFTNNLYVGEAASVSTNAFRLLANGSTIIDGDLSAGGSPAHIRVNSAGELETDNLTLINGGVLDMRGGVADINGVLNLSDNDATIFGHGTVDVLSSLNNNGRINVTVGTSLNFVGGASTVWDLDGNLETGDILALTGDLSFTNGTVSDAFNGSMTIAGRTITIAPAWTLGAGGTTNFTNSASVLAGGQMTLAGRINAGGGSGSISATLLASGMPVIEVATGANLNLSGQYRTAAGGILTKNGEGSVTVHGAQNHAAGAQLRVNAGVVTLNTDAGVAGATLTVISNASVNFASTQHLAALDVTGGRTQLRPGGSRVLVTSALAVDATDSLLDVWEHAAVVDYTTSSPLPTVQSWISSGRNDGNWNGFGITSSAAASAPILRGIGILEGSDWINFTGTNNFEGETIDATSVLLKYTYNGDTDLNDVVDFDDYVRIDLGFNNGLTGWVNGDFNFSGTVEFDDYVLIDFAFNNQNSTLIDALNWLEGEDRSGFAEPGVIMVARHFELFGLDYARAFYTAVPEPAFGLFALMLIPRFGTARNRVRRSAG